MNRIGDNLICTGSNQEIVAAFCENDVEFIVVGGLSVAWYCPEREADDMDLLVKCTPENSVRISRAFHSLNLEGYDESSFSRSGVQASLKHHHYADIITESPTGLSFDNIREDSERAKLFGFSVLVPSRRGLIALKEDAIANEQGSASKHANDIELLSGAV